MSNLTQEFRTYQSSNLLARIKEMESFLPPTFYIVEYCAFPEAELAPFTKFLCESETEAQEWIRNNTTKVLRHESGEFYSPVYGNRHEERFWTEIYKQDKRAQGRPIAGVCYRIWKATPVHLALRSLGYAQ